MADALELYEISTEEELKTACLVMFDAYERPFNSLWEVLKGTSQDQLLERYWQTHITTAGSRWIAVRRKNSDKATIGIAQWILHESHSVADEKNAIPSVDWWPDDDHLKDITHQVCEIFFGRRPAYLNRPHVLLNICCVAWRARRQGAGRLLVDWGRKLADEKNIETFVEAALDGVRLYESAGFTQIESYMLDAKLPKEFEGKEDRKAWLMVRNRVLPTPCPVISMWRPKRADWKQGDVLERA